MRSNVVISSNYPTDQGGVIGARPAHAQVSRWSGWVLLPPAALASVLLVLFTADTWVVVRVPHGALHFADLLQVTATADCVKEGSWTMQSSTCDPFGRPFNYPPLWAHGFAFLGLGLASTDVVGYGLAAAMVGAVLLLTVTMGTRLGRPSSAMLTVAAVVSPPFLLAAERGNIDIAVYLAVVAGAAAIASRRHWLGAVILACAVVAKLYPLGAFGSLLLGQSPRRPRYGPLLLAVLVVAAWLIATASDLRLVLERTPQFMHISYGAGVLPAGMRRAAGAGGPEITILDRLAGLILLGGAVVGLVGLRIRSRTARRLLRTDWAEELATDRTATCFILAGGGILILSYAAGVSYDYRLMFASLAVAGFLAAPPARHAGLLSPARLAGALTAALWLTFVVPGYGEYLGDLLLAAIVPCLVLVLGRLAVASLSGTGREREALATSGRSS